LIARILVLDGEAPAAVAVVRSLVRAGHRVSVLAASPHSAAAAVRGRRSAFRVADPTEDPTAWRARVESLAGRFDLLLPVTDATVVLADRIPLPEGTVLARPVDGPLDPVLDKIAVLDRARDLGIPVLPRREVDDLETAPLPAVLKPKRSRAFGSFGVRSATARVIGTREELLAAARDLDRDGFGCYAEPWIPGVGRGIFLLLEGGAAVATFAHRRVREAHPLGGPSAVCESVPADRSLLARAETLAADLGVSGPFMAEFRGDGEDQVLLEVNARYWGSLGLAIDAGVDFPALHVAGLLGAGNPDREIRGPDGWTVGLRRRNLAFDLRHALGVLRGLPEGLDLPFPGIRDTLKRMIVDDSRGLLYRTDDPAPGRAHLLRLIRKALNG
jgi:hypothetical protein